MLNRHCYFLPLKPAATLALCAPPCRANPGHSYAPRRTLIRQGWTAPGSMRISRACVRLRNMIRNRCMTVPFCWRSLNIKIDQQCFDRPTEQQAPCLMQNTSQLVLEDGHSQSMVAALTSGPNSDLIGQITYTRLAGGGAYSPYVG